MLRRTVVELDGQNTVTRLFSLDDSPVESANTLFYDGIISAETISLKINCTDSQRLTADYLYVDVSEDLPEEIEISGKPLLLDFGTNTVEIINKKLSLLFNVLQAFSLGEIIAACCYYPALATGKTADLQPGRQTKLILWEKADLVNKKLTQQTQIKELG